MGSIIKLVTSWNEHNEAQVVEPAKSLSAREEVYGPFIENNTQRRQIQYNAQRLEQIRISKLNRFDPDYKILSQPFGHLTK
jgi:hypothetical protein